MSAVRFTVSAASFTSVHVNARARAADVDGAAHDVGGFMASGMLLISTRSAGDMPLHQRGKAATINDTPMAFAALSSVCAMET